MKILRIKITRARARQAIPASTVKVVSSRVTFLLHTNSVCLLINLQSSGQGCVRGRHGRGQGQGQIISDQGHVRL